MNRLKKGPELKLSELKVPEFVYDLYYDLKVRHLLPLVALLIVAMVAAPIYFKGPAKSEPDANATAGVAATASSVDAGGETLVVARSEPGLRDYRRRLQHYRALNPFGGGGAKETGADTEVTNSAPTASAPSAEAPVEAAVVGGESSGSSAAPVKAPISPESSGIPTEPSAANTGGRTETRYAADSIDVRIVTIRHRSTEQAKAKKAQPRAQVRRNLPELTMLPARGIPAATYIGLTNDGKKALFVVSSDVVSLFGEGKCVIGTQSCQLLALEPNLPETFVYGPQERTYRIELLKIDRTYSAKPRRASLGATRGKKQSHGGIEDKGHGGEGTEAGGPTGEEPAERG